MTQASRAQRLMRELCAASLLADEQWIDRPRPNEFLLIEDA
jgi:hypothetical protein